MLCDVLFPANDLFADSLETGHDAKKKFFADRAGLPQEYGKSLEILHMTAQLVELGEDIGGRRLVDGGLHHVDVDGEAHHGGDGAEDLLLKDRDTQVLGHIFVNGKVARIEGDQIAVDFGAPAHFFVTV
jgi:hypothetical protein